MSMKKTDLDKQMALKINGQMKGTGVPGRFGQGASALVDKREQRRLDSQAGLLPFACKLPADLVRQLHDRAARHDGGINALVAGLLADALR